MMYLCFGNILLGAVIIDFGLVKLPNRSRLGNQIFF